MINLKNISTLKLMPEVLRKDIKIQALSYALKKTAMMVMEKVDCTNVYGGFNTLEERIIDLLALELRAQYYDSSINLEDKRNAVQKAMVWHCKAGTVAAVKELTNLVWKSKSAKVQEWFEYGADPYIFRITLGTDILIDESKIDTFLSALKNVKNTRSHLQAITFNRQIQNNIYIGTASMKQGKIVITDFWRDQYKTQGDMYNGTMLICKPKKIIIKEG